MKRITGVICLCILCLSLLIYSFADPRPEAPDPTENTVAAPSDAVMPPEPAGTETVVTTVPSPLNTVGVSYYNRKPQLQAAWEALAQEFSHQTGIRVNILSSVPPSAEENAIPTLCCISDGEALAAEVFLPLSDSVAFANLANPELTLRVEDKPCGIASHVEPFGLIYNTALLARAGYTGSEIRSFAQLKEAVELITANRESLGFDAFAKPGNSFPRLAAAVLPEGDDFWELYRDNAFSGDISSRGAVFALGTLSEMTSLSEKSNLQLDMLPLYTGTGDEGNKGFDVFVTGYWCIRGDAHEEDIQGALAFLNFLVSPRSDGSVPVDELQILAPYRQAVYAGNSAETLFRNTVASGKVCVPRTEPAGELLKALQTYTAAPSEENKNAITDLLTAE